MTRCPCISHPTRFALRWIPAQYILIGKKYKQKRVHTSRQDYKLSCQPICELSRVDCYVAYTTWKIISSDLPNTNPRGHGASPCAKKRRPHQISALSCSNLYRYRQRRNAVYYFFLTALFFNVSLRLRARLNFCWISCSWAVLVRYVWAVVRCLMAAFRDAAVPLLMDTSAL